MRSKTKIKLMKKIISSAAIVLITMIFCVLLAYVLTAFTYYETNPQCWDEGARFAVSFLGAFGGLIFGLLVTVALND